MRHFRPSAAMPLRHYRILRHQDLQDLRWACAGAPSTGAFASLNFSKRTWKAAYALQSCSAVQPALTEVTPTPDDTSDDCHHQPTEEKRPRLSPHRNSSPEVEQADHNPTRAKRPTGIAPRQQSSTSESDTSSRPVLRRRRRVTTPPATGVRPQPHTCAVTGSEPSPVHESTVARNSNHHAATFRVSRQHDPDAREPWHPDN